MEYKGQPVAKALTEKLRPEIDALRVNGINPCLAVVRVGVCADDLCYEKSISRCFAQAGCSVKSIAMREDCAQAELECMLITLNRDRLVHGILLLRPLPKHMDAAYLQTLIAPQKDVDGMSPVTLGRVFVGDTSAFAPCTAQAVMEILDHYQIPVAGKRVTIVGRSTVVGKPLFALLLARDATVTVCHTKTDDLARVCRDADILVACAGKPGMITTEHVGEACTVIDVGVNIVNGLIVGDVSAQACAASQHFTPVPGGVGAVTNAVLLAHTVRAANSLFM